MAMLWMRYAVGLALGLALAGCGAKERDAGTLRDEGFAAVYSKYWEAKPLSEQQVAEIRGVVRDFVGKEGPIWFVYVHSNDGNEGKGRGYQVSVYFRPTEQKDRLRKGTVVTIDHRRVGWWRQLSEEQNRAIATQLPNGYVDVTEPGERVGALKIPAEVDVPVIAAEGMSDEEIVGVVDSLRSLRGKRVVEPTETVGADGTRRVSTPVFNRIDEDMPIMHMERSEDVITVSLGWMAYPLNGRGLRVTMRRTEKRYVVVSVGAWVS
jgi:hypothetical protein